MTAQEALNAYFAGEKVQYKLPIHSYWSVIIASTTLNSIAKATEFKLIPKTVQVNGKTVLAPYTGPRKGITAFYTINDGSPDYTTNIASIPLIWLDPEGPKQLLEALGC